MYGIFQSHYTLQESLILQLPRPSILALWFMNQVILPNCLHKFYLITCLLLWETKGPLETSHYTQPISYHFIVFAIRRYTYLDWLLEMSMNRIHKLLPSVDISHQLKGFKIWCDICYKGIPNFCSTKFSRYVFEILPRSNNRSFGMAM